MTVVDYDSIYRDYEGVVCIFQGEDKIVYANERFAHLLGYTQKEIININIFDLVSADDRSEFTNGVFLNAQKSQITIRFFHKSGSHLYFSIYPYKFNNRYMIIGEQLKRNYLGFSFDILKDEFLDNNTGIDLEINDISEIIEGNKESLNLILGNLPVDLWIKDKQHRYIYMNDIMLLRTGVDKDFYYLKNDFDIYDAEVANDFVTSDMEAITSHKKIQFTFQSKRARFTKWTEVSKVPVYNKNNEYIGLIGCAIDITMSKSSEEQLQYEKDAYLMMLHHLYDFAFCVNQEGVIETTYGAVLESIQDFGKPSYQEFFHVNEEMIKSIDDAFNNKTSTIVTTLFQYNIEITIKPVVSQQQVKIFGFGKELEK